ncbi:MAG: translation initiation factor IF-2 [Parcubacteria group bacterium Gr01-1014_31]|nr:MAG: translation initiation factor IF-2 [Parcubacteria group bacterium Gr01-1014_31]
MNVTELSRRLRMDTRDLLVLLPQLGFDIGRRAIKVDDRVAQKIIEQWPVLMKKLRAQTEDSAAAAAAGPDAAVAKRQVPVPATLSVREFAQRAGLPVTKVLAVLMRNGVLASINERIDAETATIVGADLGVEVTAEAATAGESAAAQTVAKPTQGAPRAPVIVVLGHVDHGKTKLLDAIRRTDVASGEAGGITQHIGAYQVTRKDRRLTFIDTPGHEAFATMRSRGAQVADIAILVVGADDGVQPQTKESIKIIHSAGLPLVVAINKVDKPDANVERIKQELAALELLPEDWGGSTICVPISAKVGTGIDALLDTLLLVADMEKEKIVADPALPAIGTVIESHVDKGEGPVATMLVQTGTLRRGDLLQIGGTYYGKVRALKDYRGRPLEEAPPSTPVRLLGLKAVPSVGDVASVTTTVDRKSKADTHALRGRATNVYTPSLSSTPDSAAPALTFNVVLKADVLGSLEALMGSLDQFQNPEVGVKVVGRGLGNITEGDLQTAEAGHAAVLGFNVNPTPAAATLAHDRGIEVKTYKIIYDLLGEIRKRLEAMLKPEIIRTELGTLKVLAVFRQDKSGQIIGGAVTAGRIGLGAQASVARDGVVLANGKISQLQQNKVAVQEVAQGRECGIRFEGKAVAQVGDTVQVYREEVRERKLALAA